MGGLIKRVKKEVVGVDAIGPLCNRMGTRYTYMCSRGQMFAWILGSAFRVRLICRATFPF